MRRIRANQQIMSSINCSPLASQLLRKFFVILVYLSSAFSNPPCGLYGAPPCQFLPAPPGQTPSCARPGRTYCEHIDNYPTYLIKHLVRKWGYEAKSIIVDETWDEFESLNLPTHDIPSFYDPALIFGTQHQYGPNNFNGYKYDGPNGIKASSSSVGYSSSSSSSSTSLSSSSVSSSSASTVGSSSNSGYPEPIFIPKPQNSDAAKYDSQQQALNKNKYTNVGQQNEKVTNYTPGIWLKRFIRDLSSRNRSIPWNDFHDVSPMKNITAASSRDVSINLDLLDIVGVNKDNHPQRVKRQSSGRSSLCQTSSQYVMPQAALNSKGNWMFVVNEQNTARQLVKAELCVSTTCSNLCQLPNGYTSRCEQKFVQKRLIALQGNGENLYTDSFWFPSCCVCTIASS